MFFYRKETFSLKRRWHSEYWDHEPSAWILMKSSSQVKCKLDKPNYGTKKKLDLHQGPSLDSVVHAFFLYIYKDYNLIIIDDRSWSLLRKCHLINSYSTCKFPCMFCKFSSDESTSTCQTNCWNCAKLMIKWITE